MLLKVFFSLLKALISLIGFVLSPLINLIPFEYTDMIMNGVTSITNFVEVGLGIVAYIMGPVAMPLLTASIFVRLAWYNSALLVNVLRKIPYVNQFIK